MLCWYNMEKLLPGDATCEYNLYPKCFTLKKLIRGCQVVIAYLWFVQGRRVEGFHCPCRNDLYTRSFQPASDMATCGNI